MAGVRNLNLIHLFDFYLIAAFVLSTLLRFRQYHAILELIRAVPGRWPRLFALVRQHLFIFLTWSTVLPGLLALALSVIHSLACRLVWPQAKLTPALLADHWLALPGVALCLGAMIGVDAYATLIVGHIDRELMMKYFDQAEFWLRSWTAPVLRVFTLGFINPRRMVAEEVRKALVEASRLINSTFWWIILQVGVRFLFGLSLWLSYAWIASQ